MTDKLQLKQALLALGLDEETIDEFLTKVRDVNRVASGLITRSKPKLTKIVVKYRDTGKAVGAPVRQGYQAMATSTLHGLEAAARAAVRDVAGAVSDLQRTGAPTPLSRADIEARAAVIEADLAVLDPNDFRAGQLRLELRSLRRGHSGLASIAAVTLAGIPKAGDKRRPRPMAE